MKRGFKKKREALESKRTSAQQDNSDLEMTFGFYRLVYRRYEKPLQRKYMDHERKYPPYTVAAVLWKTENVRDPFQGCDSVAE